MINFCNLADLDYSSLLAELRLRLCFIRCLCDCCCSAEMFGNAVTFLVCQESLGGINIKSSPSTQPDIFSSCTEVLQSYYTDISQQTLLNLRWEDPVQSAAAKMKFLALLLLVVSSQAGLVRREAEADPEAEPGYGYSRGAVSAPVCHSVPVTTCNPRQVETPRQECHQEYDEIVDTTITEHCEEVVTTTCHQTSTQTKHSSAVVGHDSKLVASGVAAGPLAVGGYAAPVVKAGYGKREAEADPEADPSYGYGAVGPVAAAAPVCQSVPVRKCSKVPVSTPRKVARTVCKTVTDITTIEDCQETVTTECTQTSTKVATHSKVVGTDTKVGPAAVVATHAAPAVAVAHPAPVVAGYGGYGLAGYSGGYGGRYGGW